MFFTSNILRTQNLINTCSKQLFNQTPLEKTMLNGLSCYINCLKTITLVSWRSIKKLFFNIFVYNFIMLSNLPQFWGWWFLDFSSSKRTIYSFLHTSSLNFKKTRSRNLELAKKKKKNLNTHFTRHILSTPNIKVF